MGGSGSRSEAQDYRLADVPPTRPVEGSQAVANIHNGNTYVASAMCQAGRLAPFVPSNNEQHTTLPSLLQTGAQGGQAPCGPIITRGQFFRSWGRRICTAICWPGSAFSSRGIGAKVFTEYRLHPGLVENGGHGGGPACLDFPHQLSSVPGRGKWRTEGRLVPDPTSHPLTLSSFPSPTDQGCSAQPRTMGRKKIQISRILDQRNRQVSSLGGKAGIGGRGHSLGKGLAILGNCRGMSLDDMSRV